MIADVVTGSSRSIGKAIAIELSRVGYQVHGTYHAAKIEAEVVEEERIKVVCDKRDTVAIIAALQHAHPAE